MNLTTANEQAYASPIAPHCAVRFSSLSSRVHRHSPKCLFLCPQFYGGLIQGASARRPLDRSTNLFKPATQLFSSDRGSLSIIKRAYAMNNLSVFSKEIRQHNDFYCLNDLHTASGYGQNKRPKYFLNNQQTKELIAEIEIGGIPPIHAKQGFGTFASKEIVIAYGSWLSPKLNLAVIRAFLGHQAQPAIEQDTSHRLNDDQLGHIYHTAMAYSRATNQHYSTQFARLKRAFSVSSYKHIRSVDYAAACKLLNVAPKQLGEPAPKVAFDQNAAQLLTDQPTPAMAPYLQRIMCDGNGKPIMHIPNNYFVMPAESFANAIESESAFINTSTIEDIAKVCMEKLAGRARFCEKRSGLVA
jgi:hypothetical protein